MFSSEKVALVRNLLRTALIENNDQCVTEITPAALSLLNIPEREHVCPLTSIQPQLLTINKTSDENPTAMPENFFLVSDSLKLYYFISLGEAVNPMTL